jgi:hypothetical protein
MKKEMMRMFKDNTPSINMTMVGFGQAGSRMVDLFASVKTNDGQYVYNTLALNSNDGDLLELKYIPRENRVSLKLGGLGKNPEKAMSILENNESAKRMLKEFITERVRPQDDIVMFFAGLGGGTGTSTIIKSIEEFAAHHNRPKVIEELKRLQSSTTPDEFAKNLNQYKAKAVLAAREKFIKIGIVVTLPRRSDGPDVLRQVNDFANRLWNLRKDPMNGIAFIIFADNQFFWDEWKELGANAQHDNFRDYANEQIFKVIHELNVGTNGGGTSITFDPRDFRRVILEGSGSLVISRLTKSIKEIQNNYDLKSMFLEAITRSSLHDPISLMETDKDTGATTMKKVYHIGLLAILDKDMKNIGSGFLDEAINDIVEKIPLQGTVFSGYLEGKNNYTATVYTFFKTEALPTRLTKGLVEEYNEFRERQNAISYKTDTIQEIKVTEDDLGFAIEDLNLDLEEIGIEIKEPEAKNVDDEIDLDNLDFSDVKI